MKGQKTLWEKEKLLVTSNFSFSHSVFKRLKQQTDKNQGLFGKGLRIVETRDYSVNGKFLTNNEIVHSSILKTFTDDNVNGSSLS